MNLSRLLQSRVFAAVLISLIITAISSALIVSDIFHPWHLRLADTLYSRNEPSNDIVIIGIDDKSTQPTLPGLGRFSQWSRENYAKLLEILAPESPKVITFDILFHTYSSGITPEQIGAIKNSAESKQAPDEKLSAYQEGISDYFSVMNHPSDNIFAEELRKNDNIILMGTISEDTNTANFPIAKFLKGKPKIGITTITLDPDGVARRVQPTYTNAADQKSYDDIALASVKKYLGKEKIDLPLEDGKLNLNFFGKPYSYKIVSFSDVLAKNFAPDTFKNKIVLIGVTTLKEGQDRVLTPRSNETLMPGIELRANEIQTILEQKFLTNQSKLGTIVTILLTSFVLTLLFNFAGIIVSLIALFVALIGYYFDARFLYARGFILNMIYPFIAIILSYIAAWIYRYFVADKKKREIKSAFGHYVSEELVEEISKNPDMVHLGGEKKIVTVFFSDLKNSTTLSEKTEITSWVSQVNEYFTVMESVIKRLGGTIDKYEGDAIMGFWNAPLEQKDHVIRAYTAAVEMKKVLKTLNEKWQKENKQNLEMRIGINTGEAIVGNFGSVNRFDYTVMGDTVNTASRLESCASKTYGGVIIAASFEQYIDEKTLREKLLIREVDTVFLPGKKQPVTLFELVCLKEELNQEIEDSLRNYAEGLAAYRARNFEEAEAKFKVCTNDKVAEVMLARTQILKENKSIKELDENFIFRIQNK